MFALVQPVLLFLQFVMHPVYTIVTRLIAGQTLLLMWQQSGVSFREGRPCRQVSCFPTSNGMEMPRMILMPMVALLAANVPARAQRMNEKNTVRECRRDSRACELPRKRESCAEHAIECRVQESSRQARRRRWAAPCRHSADAYEGIGGYVRC
jgi:hypothetical protein